MMSIRTLNSASNAEKIYRLLPEIKDLEATLEHLRPYSDIEILDVVEYKGLKFPIYSIAMGSKNLQDPCLLLVGGVHGLERIGTQVINAYLASTENSVRWDDFFTHQISHQRLIFVPLLNPVGMYRMSRSNGNNVDLMRNSPVESEEKQQFLYGGHRYSSKLPFYRGEEGKMELENQALWKLVREKVFPAKVSIALDCHSGFGNKDRLWFPYARTKKPFPHLAEVHALKEIFDKTYQHHVYTIEAQGQQYTTHGDMWDFFFDEFQKTKKEQIFLPLTLEMGSWMWIRKNPFQVFNPLGIFNPLSPHREKRMLRRHKTLLEFLRRATLSYGKWAHLPETEQKQHEKAALKLWYPGEAS